MELFWKKKKISGVPFVNKRTKQISIVVKKKDTSKQATRDILKKVKEKEVLG
jgi:hypothetical protein